MTRQIAGMLRRNPSRLEVEAWRWLRMLRSDGIAVRRQHPIGRYVADFAIMRARLAIEVDGALHEQQLDQDKKRDEAFAVLGWRVLRLTPTDLNDGPALLARVRAAAAPSPRGEGEGGGEKHRLQATSVEVHPTPQPPPLAGRGSDAASSPQGAGDIPAYLRRRTRANRTLAPRRKS